MNYLAILLLVLAACGNPARQKAQNKKVDEVTRSLDAKYNPKKPDSPAACTTVVGFSLTNVTYSTKALTWGEAVNSAPEGKRIATRGELAMLYDSGALADLNFMVWTGTPKDSSSSYVLNPEDGMIEYADINGELTALYVDIK